MATVDTFDATLHRRTLRFLVAVAAERELPGVLVSGGHAAGEGYIYNFNTLDNCLADFHATSGTAVDQDSGTPVTPRGKKRKLARSSSKLREPLQDITNGPGSAPGMEKATDEDVELNSDDVAMLQAKIEALVHANEPITRVTRTAAQAAQYFKDRCLPFAHAHFRSRTAGEVVELYQCDGILRPVLFPLYSSAGAMAQGEFSLLPLSSGFIASYAQRHCYKRQSTVEKMQADHCAFGATQCVKSLDALNALKSRRERLDFVLHCEFRQEAKLAQIVSEAKARQETSSPVKVICIAGPTSSGKTTFSNKLCMYLRNAGMFGQPLSIDDYYLPLEEQPKYLLRQQLSDIDFNAPESLDWNLVHEHINALTNGQSIMMPCYNMRTSTRDPPGTPVKALPPNGILVIEGIHALSPEFTQGMDRRNLFRIFISPVTSLQIDDANAVKTTDHRLLRKLCRDFTFRGRSGSRTLMAWVKARRGEHIWVFPNQNDVDFVMNSAGEYEVAVLAGLALRLLREVPVDDVHYAKAQEVIERFSQIEPWQADLVPSTSLLREFIGDGVFDCH